MKIAKFPETIDMALDRVKLSPSSSEGFAFIGMICSIFYRKTLLTSFDISGESTLVKYAVLTDPCHFVEVGEEFSKKPYAIGVQKGSPLKDILSERYNE